LPLRPYQAEALEAVSQEWRAGHRRVVLVMPTGAGKTATGCEAVRRAVARGRRVLWLAHRTELLSQASERLDAEGIPHGMIQAGRPADPSAPVQVASVDTLRTRGQAPPADLVIPDEAHHTPADSQQALLANYEHAHFLGLTATPQRGDGRGLGAVFNALVTGPSIRELTDLGHLVPLDIIGPDKEAASRTIAHDPVRAYLETKIQMPDGRITEARGRRAVVYAATVRQAQDFAAAFNRAGIPAESVEGNTAADKRRYVLSEVSRGGLLVVVNCQVLTEGWDAPALEVCILARRVGTAGLYLQMVGRVLRSNPGKSRALLLDLGGSVHTHGRPEAEREYTLDGKGIYLAGKREPLGVCPGCGLSVQVWPCTRCGHQPESRDVEIAEQPIALITENPSAALEDRHLAKLISKAISRGYKPGWVAAVYERLFGRRLDSAGFARVRSELSASPQWHAARAARERGASGGETSLGEL
jgi:DNA repair protein RadD